MRWVYYSIAVVATALAAFLWLVLFGAWTGARSVPVSAPRVSVAPLGRLPVPPRLRPADATRAILFEDLQAGRAVCDAAGFYARQDGAEAVRVLVEDRPVPCP